MDDVVTLQVYVYNNDFMKCTYHVDLSPKLFDVKRNYKVKSLSELWCDVPPNMHPLLFI